MTNPSKDFAPTEAAALRTIEVMQDIEAIVTRLLTSHINDEVLWDEAPPVSGPVSETVAAMMAELHRRISASRAEAMMRL